MTPSIGVWATVGSWSMGNSFTYKQLRARFILAQSGVVFPGTNSNTLIITGLRMSAQIQASSTCASLMQLRVWGMKRADMDAITVAWAIPGGVVLDHLIILEANNGDGWSMVYSGTIIEAQPEYRGAPDTYLSVSAVTGYQQALLGETGTSYQEDVDIGFLAGTLADKMGFTFVNGGANAVLKGGIQLWGSLVDQLDQACRMAACDYYLTGTPSAPTGAPRAGAVTPENSRGTLTITPRGKPIAGAEVAVFLTPETGLIGYPVYGRDGLSVQALWRPAFGVAIPIELKTIVPAATGTWYPYSMTHLLDANLPNGKWQTNMSCNRAGV